jgi:hypothetical protein
VTSIDRQNLKNKSSGKKNLARRILFIMLKFQNLLFNLENVENLYILLTVHVYIYKDLLKNLARRIYIILYMLDFF